MSKNPLFATRASRMKASEIRELLKLLDQPGIISFAGGIPDPALFPADAFSQAFQAALGPQTQAQALQYSVSEGYVPLREWLVQHMREIGVTCDIDNILITSGSQQALDYLGKLFLSPGDTALVGWPTYLGALAAFNAYEPRFDRLNGNSGAAEHKAAAGDGAVKFAYLSADFANPTGETLDRQGREALLDLAEELDCAIIEDGAYQALRYDGDPIPPILSLELARKGSIENCRTIYCGSFSKTLSPGLRMGWVVAPKPTISQLVLLKQAADLHSATINQMAVHDVAQACFDSHIPQVRAVYQNRRDVMLDALEQHMPDGVEWTRPEGGMFIWVTLPAGVSGSELLARASDTVKVAFVPGQAFFPDGSGANTIRLSFSNSDEAAIREGIRRLGEVLRA
ncbi:MULTISPECIES: PLP-dependent aminotransferase family protein [unclassified Ruegeria]|uniref:aminotransferase-like domain-containing protein n=1 Tax=unclassified Ruegeria TaxID=2625375 RepID=UPI001491F52C|nr:MULTISPECIES: PLP-dependent aminotransferase family protein [unclassified Ruegeria]NOD49499.1 aminotransferase class I/II-fold pyridoxal phosphate-dependent enzyme [Ruegeria sp. HKCCD5849]NOD53812.1 aminotransferase class I/II-fold pyridoxal phosphate-dependent enzyme [Ruegeria sp. HKCCD5851]NOD69827.1 aminotransferase class I/II-fold pyridoxal phosphate-dependent enzyme [Ruegeria sp. HKCCD7303]